jgi:3'-5' exoribonuclease
MKSPYVTELQANQVITATFLVQHKDIRQKKTGEPYLSLVLGDRTGELDAKMWDNVAEVMATFERDDFLRVRGLLQIFQNRLQLTIHKLQRVSDDAVDLTDFFPASRRSSDDMFAELLNTIRGLNDEHLRALLLLIVEDPEVSRRLKLAPAAKSIHHAYLGGLLEHVLSLCTLAKLTTPHYPHVNLDLVLAGVILHDIGKIYELTYERSFGYSSVGQLLGHMVIALRMIEDKVRLLPSFPSKLKTLLDHMIISHHGELEYGSPKTPLFPEALLLHHLDNLDSKMESMRAALDKDRQVEGSWTGYVNSLERPVLKMTRYFAEPDDFAPLPEPINGGHRSPSNGAPSLPVNGSPAAGQPALALPEQAVAASVSAPTALPLPPTPVAPQPAATVPPLPGPPVVAPGHPNPAPAAPQPPKPSVQAASVAASGGQNKPQPGKGQSPFAEKLLGALRHDG